MRGFFRKPDKKTWAYICTVILSVSLLFLGSRMVSPQVGVYAGEVDGESPEIFKAHIERIIGVNYEETTLGLTSKVIMFEANIRNGSEAGRTVAATQRLDGLLPITAKEVEQGDDVLLVKDLTSPGSEESFIFSDYYRLDPLVVLGVVFLGLLILFGRREGVNTVLSLVLTCLAVFLVFIPSILCGWNIYLMSVVTCIYVVLMTLMLVSGPTKKTFVASLGCFGGLTVAGILTSVMTVLLRLSGATDEDSVYLIFLDTPSPIDLRAIIFAAILIGAMGAVMDVAMSLSSSLLEIRQKAPHTTRKELIRSGFSIGRDMMATMSNTLILAYIGCALSVVLLLVSYNSSLSILLNKEMIVVEILQALVGSMGILFTIPLTAVAASYIYIGPRHKTDQKCPDNLVKNQEE